MERRFFKLSVGYMHVDAVAIAFTRSGNWGEVARVKEKSGGFSVGHMVRIAIGVALLAIGAAFAALHSAHGGSAAALVLAAAGGSYGFYTLATSLKNDFARSFRIPFPKIRSLHYEEGALEIVFLNARFREEHMRVDLLEDDAQWVMTQLAEARERGAND